MERLPEALNSLTCDLVGEVVQTFGHARLRVTGTSMVPAVRPGDLLSIERATLNEISQGEIVLFAREDRLFAHRVVEKANGPHELHLITCGDRLLQNDPPVSATELFGRVTSIQRGKQILPANQVSAMQLFLGPLLRSSDRATYLFLRLAQLRRAFAGQGAECPS